MGSCWCCPSSCPELTAVTTSHCHRIPLLPCPPAITSHCHHVPLPPHPTATTSHCHHIPLPRPAATISLCQSHASQCWRLQHTPALQHQPIPLPTPAAAHWHRDVLDALPMPFHQLSPPTNPTLSAQPLLGDEHVLGCGGHGVRSAAHGAGAAPMLSWKLSLLISQQLPTFQKLFLLWLGMKTNISEISWIT